MIFEGIYLTQISCFTGNNFCEWKIVFRRYYFRLSEIYFFPIID